MPELIVRPHGRLGNHILQFVTAQTLAAAVPGLVLHNYSLPAWGLSAGGFRRKQPFVPAITRQDSDLSLIAEMLRSGEMPLARLYCMVLQADAWGEVDRFRQMLPLFGAKVDTAGPDEVLLNVRADEILKARHRDYGPIPLGFYTAVLRNTGLKPVFMGQLGDDSYSTLLRQTFPDARFIPSQGVLQDFDAMRRAKHLALSVSTFSWVAAWLSNAESLHLPVLGMFNPAQRPDIALLPRGDARYHYYGFAPRRWTASAEQFAQLQDLTPAPVLTPSAVEDLRIGADLARAPARAADAARLHAAVRRTKPFLGVFNCLYRKP